MTVDLKKIDASMKEFVDFFVKNLAADADRKFHLLQSKCHKFDEPEEKLFFIFLTTHFDSPTLADEFYQRASWGKMQQIDEIGLHQICQEYFLEKEFTGEYLIGDHRRYFRCLPKNEKVSYSAKILSSYKKAVGRYGSQVAFFEIHNNNARFDVLYQRITTFAL